MMNPPHSSADMTCVKFSIELCILHARASANSTHPLHSYGVVYIAENMFYGIMLTIFIILSFATQRHSLIKLFTIVQKLKKIVDSCYCFNWPVLQMRLTNSFLVLYWQFIENQGTVVFYSGDTILPD